MCKIMHCDRIFLRHGLHFSCKLFFVQLGYCECVCVVLRGGWKESVTQTGIYFGALEQNY